MTDYPWTPLYYSGLTQVKYYDAESGCIRGGLCYNDRLVDAASGADLPIEVVIERAIEHGWDKEDAVVELSWNDLNPLVL